MVLLDHIKHFISSRLRYAEPTERKAHIFLSIFFFVFLLFICFTLSNNYNNNNSTAKKNIHKNYLSNIITDIHEIQKKNYPFKRRQKANEKEETIYSNLAATTVNYMGIQANKKYKVYLHGEEQFMEWELHTHTQTQTKTQTLERHWMEEKEENCFKPRRKPKIYIK